MEPMVEGIGIDYRNVIQGSFEGKPSYPKLVTPTPKYPTYVHPIVASLHAKFNFWWDTVEYLNMQLIWRICAWCHKIHTIRQDATFNLIYCPEDWLQSHGHRSHPHYLARDFHVRKQAYSVYSQIKPCLSINLPPHSVKYLKSHISPGTNILYNAPLSSMWPQCMQTAS